VWRVGDQRCGWEVVFPHLDHGVGLSRGCRLMGVVGHNFVDVVVLYILYGKY